MPDPQLLAICVRYGKLYQRFLCHQLALASCEFYVYTMFWMDVYVQNIFYCHIFSHLVVFKHDFIRCVDFTRIADSNIASDDVTN